MNRSPDRLQQQFAQLAWQFNCHIATMAHATWLRYPEQASDPSWSAHLLARCGVTSLQDWHLADPSSRIWLLDGASLQTLLQAIYGLWLRPQVVRTVDKTRRQALREQCNVETWDAATDAAAPKLPGSGAKMLQRNADDATLLGDALDERRHAASALIGLVEPSRRAVAQRARMRLPFDWLHDDPLSLPEATGRDLADWIARSWIPRRSPAWAWLF